jgi:hypothetical protein
MLEGALGLLRRGVKVVALRPRTKEPLTSHGVKDATSDETIVRRLWGRCPNANVAVACGASGMVVLDVDIKNGGKQSLPQLRDVLGDLSACALASTPGGGYHVGFREPRDRELKESLGNGCIGLLPGIDILAGERYAVTPPSERDDGSYKWRRDFDAIESLPTFPDALVQMVANTRRNRKPTDATGTRTAGNGEMILHGWSNHAAFEMACTFARQGLSEHAIFEELRGMRDRGRFENPSYDPLTDSEILKLVKSALQAVWQRRSRDGTNREWQKAPWPTLGAAALHGLAGDIVRAIEQQTEADPAALLASLLVGFGNSIGASAHARVQAAVHPARFFLAVVGSTSSGCKGTSLNTITPFLRFADPGWFDECRKSGFGSGEAIIAELSGAYRSKDDKSPIEHRAFVVEPEFGRLLTVNSRDGSTLSPILRSAWDDGRLERRLSKVRMIATDAHVSTLAHITPEELREKLPSIEVACGFANRVLFVLSRRARKLPTGGHIPRELIEHFGKRLRDAMAFARGVGLMQRTAETEPLWASLYYAEPD